MHVNLVCYGLLVKVCLNLFEHAFIFPIQEQTDSTGTMCMVARFLRCQACWLFGSQDHVDAWKRVHASYVLACPGPEQECLHSLFFCILARSFPQEATLPLPGFWDHKTWLQAPAGAMHAQWFDLTHHMRRSTCSKWILIRYADACVVLQFYA